MYLSVCVKCILKINNSLNEILKHHNPQPPAHLRYGLCKNKTDEIIVNLLILSYKIKKTKRYIHDRI